MIITCLSDSHNQHEKIPNEYLTGGDCIVFAGDMSIRGSRKEIEEFLIWFSDLPYKYKILIAGNHDFFFEQAPEYEIQAVLEKYSNIIYLNDNGVEIEGLKFYGSPIQPFFHNWAFNRKEEEIKKHWDLIPLDTDILIVHGGPKDITNLNVTLEGEDVGCYHLKNKIIDLKNLKLFVQGHIHEGRGYFKFDKGPLMINASVLNRSYNMVNKPYYVNSENWEIINK